MKRKVVLFIIGMFFISTNSFSQQLYTLNFETVDDMYTYFKYSKIKRIISGHRGTSENGMPENFIPAMEEVLKYTSAIFEIDPRLTKDSIPIMVHDPKLDRTTNGTGIVKDFTWDELKKLKLKDAQGKITSHGINTLEEMILWAKGKTILNLDKKDLPLEMTAEIIKKHNAYAWVWITVHNIEQAKYYLSKNPNQYLSMHIKNKDALDKFIASGLPFNRMIVYIGAEIKESNQFMYEYLNKKGVLCMISSASSYDKLSSEEERAKMYRAIFKDGANILESDLPIEVSKAIQ